MTNTMRQIAQHLIGQLPDERVELERLHREDDVHFAKHHGLVGRLGGRPDHPGGR